MPYDLAKFALKDMAICSSALRKIGKTAASMEEAANSIVGYFREQFTIHNSPDKACVLARFFVTHDYAKLSDDRRAFARRILGKEPESPNFKCLVLLATAGEKPEWNSVRRSVGHQAIPLTNVSMLKRAPMIYQLIEQLGIEAETLLSPSPAILLDAAEKSYNVFYVPEGHGSPYLPAQEEFVIPYGIRSVLGFGGLLPSGNLFAVILFSKAPISSETANLFKTLALSVKAAVLPYAEDRVFSQGSRSEKGSP